MEMTRAQLESMLDLAKTEWDICLEEVAMAEAAALRAEEQYDDIAVLLSELTDEDQGGDDD